VSTRRTIQEILADYEPVQVSATGAHPAAVLVPMRPQQKQPGSLEVLLTRRADDLVSHAGQVSFPGGRIEASDDGPAGAALRETFEELGIEPGQVEVVGRLDDLYTVTGYHITPVVGIVSAAAVVTPNPREVARVFTVPLEALMIAERWQQRTHDYRGSSFRVWHFPFDSEDVWGATAAVLRGMVELLWAQRG